MSATDAPVSHTQMANAIRALAMDAVEAANSGHPGMPMGLADVATVLFTRHVRFNPEDPVWPDRDRVVLSAGHGSMLLYAALYLLGYGDVTIEEIRNFRQLGARTAGHPEFGYAGGIETTTGPLGQGLGNAVGMALAERSMAARYGSQIVDHHTYVLASDGDLMEGISQESITFAGHQKLSKLIVLWDDNGISIDGPLELSDTGDQIARFEAAGWRAERVDGHDPEAVHAALERAKTSDRPSLIACRTVIGYGAPKKAGTAASHGAALGAEEIAGAREALDWPHAPFDIPAPILEAWRSAGRRTRDQCSAWAERFAALDDADRVDFERRLSGDLPGGLAEAVQAVKAAFTADPKPVATRKASGETLNALTALVPEMLGGSADLTGSNNTRAKEMEACTPVTPGGRFVHYGIREHGMAAAMNGMALHGGVLPYSGTFLVFSDYCRPSLRLAALMRLRVIHVFTHDSIGVGEDGPTHQPVEHLAALRAMPNLNLFRPADAVETAECWELALTAHNTPSALALTRQNLPLLRTKPGDENLCARGAYELQPAACGPAKVTLLATGSEVQVAVAARARLESEGIATRVVSMPCWELFDAQKTAYKDAVLGPGTVRIAIEAAASFGWERYLGADGTFIGMTGFGRSAPAEALFEYYGITPDAVVRTARAKMKEPGADADTSSAKRHAAPS